MRSGDSASYRLRLAEGFLQEAEQDVELGRWRSAMDNSQLAVENAAKAVLALLAPVGRTHYPGSLLRQVLEENVTGSVDPAAVRRLAQLSELLGFDIHVQTDYGDEMGGRTPWELFGEYLIRHAFAMAKEAVGLARAIAINVTG